MDINDVRNDMVMRAKDILNRSYDPFAMVVVEQKEPIFEATPVLDENNFASKNQIRQRVIIEQRLRHVTREEQEEARQNQVVAKVPETVEESDHVRDRKRHEFHIRLTQLINEIGLENESGTPDHLLSDYLLNCLTAFERTVAFRAEWRGEQI